MSERVLTVYVDARCVKAYTGVGVVLQHTKKGTSREFFTIGPPATTPHRSELIAIYNGLVMARAALLEHPDMAIALHTDSDLCLKWLNGEDRPKSNQDIGLVKAILREATSVPTLVTFTKIVSGHNPAHDVARTDYRRWPALLRT